MSKDDIALEKFLKSKEKQGHLEESLFKVLNEINSNDTKTSVIKKFIRFIT